MAPVLRRLAMNTKGMTTAGPGLARRCLPSRYPGRLTRPPVEWSRRASSSRARRSSRATRTRTPCSSTRPQLPQPPRGTPFRGPRPTPTTSARHFRSACRGQWACRQAPGSPGSLRTCCRRWLRQRAARKACRAWRRCSRRRSRQTRCHSRLRQSQWCSRWRCSRWRCSRRRFRQTQR